MEKRLNDIIKEMENQSQSSEDETIKIVFPNGETIECQAIIGSLITDKTDEGVEAGFLTFGNLCTADIIALAEIFEDGMQELIESRGGCFKEEIKENFEEFLNFVGEHGTGDFVEDMANFMQSKMESEQGFDKAH